MKTIVPQTQFVTDRNGEKIAVILPLVNFQQMQEDLHDLSVIARRKKETASRKIHTRQIWENSPTLNPILG